jgi:hypothetical protein
MAADQAEISQRLNLLQLDALLDLDHPDDPVDHNSYEKAGYRESHIYQPQTPIPIGGNTMVYPSADYDDTQDEEEQGLDGARMSISTQMVMARNKN